VTHYIGAEDRVMGDEMGQEDRSNVSAMSLAWGVVAGLLLGTVIGVLTNNIGLWAGMGMLIGIVVVTITTSLRRER
jgi:F0F1-type ATP synthase assembly protein I